MYFATVMIGVMYSDGSGKGWYKSKWRGREKQIYFARLVISYFLYIAKRKTVITRNSRWDSRYNI